MERQLKNQFMNLVMDDNSISICKSGNDLIKNQILLPGLLNDDDELTTYHAIITTDEDGVLVTFPIVELEYEFDTMEEAQNFLLYDITNSIGQHMCRKFANEIEKVYGIEVRMNWKGEGTGKMYYNDECLWISFEGGVIGVLNAYDEELPFFNEYTEVTVEEFKQFIK